MAAMRLNRTGCYLAALCAVLAMPAFAADKENALYKCVDKAGVISIQSASCPAGSTQAWRRDMSAQPAAAPEPSAPPETRRPPPEREPAQAVDTRPSAPPAAPSAPARDEEAQAIDDCQAAQEFAGAVREKQWLDLSEEQVRRLYGWVAQQCKTPSRPI